jgi:D-3-phosphoglycerate dehydrogenase
MNVLIVDEMHPSIVEMPKSLGLNVDYLPEISREEFLHILPNYEGLIIRSKFVIDEPLIKLATKLKFIGRAGAGLDLIDVEACHKNHVAIFAANEGNRIAVAEHLIGMLLTLFNNIHVANQEVADGVWKREENRGTELFAKTVGVIGYGNNGQTTAERLVAFGCNVLAYDKHRYGFGNQFVTECSMEEIYREADIISLHVPLNAETVGMIDSDYLNRFKKPIYFCNVSRGETVKLQDLTNALEEGQVLGACLDVLENEKLNKLTPEQQVTFTKLTNNPKVILTPHIAGWTHQSYKRINKVLRDKIGRFLDLHQ